MFAHNSITLLFFNLIMCVGPVYLDFGRPVQWNCPSSTTGTTMGSGTFLDYVLDLRLLQIRGCFSLFLAPEWGSNPAGPCPYPLPNLEVQS